MEIRCAGNTFHWLACQVNTCQISTIKYNFKRCEALFSSPPGNWKIGFDRQIDTILYNLRPCPRGFAAPRCFSVCLLNQYNQIQFCTLKRPVSGTLRKPENRPCLSSETETERGKCQARKVPMWSINGCGSPFGTVKVRMPRASAAAVFSGRSS